jgi:putative holliday junction resolvase
MRVLGIDPGARRVGLALSDDEGRIASPHATLQVKSNAGVAAEIAALALALGAERLVIGLPLRLDGSEGEAARRVRALVARIAQHCALPVTLWDERLSTRAAERALREGGVRGAQQRALVDQVAAALLLQSYLDSQRVPAELDRDRDGEDYERD